MITILLLWIAIEDIRHRKISNRLLAGLLLCVLVHGVCFPDITIPERLVGCVLIGGLMLGIQWIRAGAFGSGDIKLMMVAGLLLGWQKGLVACSVGVVCAAIYCLWMLSGKKMTEKSKIAFGPFLCIGIETAMIFGETIVAWYVG